MASGAMLAASTIRPGTNGFWVHDSVVVDSDRAGIRYENSPNQALFENNEIHGNGKTERRGGIDIRDSQNARVDNNNLGPATIAGVSYSANGDKIGVRATDSGRSDRVNLSNIDVVGNKMNGDRIVSCGGPVACSGNFLRRSRGRNGCSRYRARSCATLRRRCCFDHSTSRGGSRGLVR